ncbi:MAG: hypothetical protein D5R99_04745 [Methanocalculus sp. MSAO_Arc1]|uniref:hypothetical protein n=1 Tax=Methanocalculus sp. MSAO_Arc1 TaxID=2293854 RepID=UPI000FF6CADE|nr:hypothetical protein [Methanocalculus sp. MSAO_Arc1]RQD80518.1 MAG: hypothetical protein D5R99_04745 [Methanocalculus sp. MSAO_Arc1]
MTQILINMNCPHCGGPLQIEQGDTLIFCPYCNTMSSSGSYEKEQSFQYDYFITQEDAIERVQEWFGEGSLLRKKAADLEKEARITGTSIIFLPFWRMTASGRAIVCGYNKEVIHNKTIVDYKKADVSRVYDWNEIACDATEIGVGHITIPDGDILPVEDDEIPVFETTHTTKDGVERAAEAIRDMVYADASAGISNITYAKAFVKPKSFAKILYPFWIVRYTYQERGYFAVVDAVTGAVASGRAPGDLNRQVAAGSIGAALSGIIAGAAVFYFIDVIPNTGGFAGNAAILPFILILLAGFIVGIVAYQTFRYGSEIVQTTAPAGGR